MLMLMFLWGVRVTMVTGMTWVGKCHPQSWWLALKGLDSCLESGVWGLGFWAALRGHEGSIYIVKAHRLMAYVLVLLIVFTYIVSRWSVWSIHIDTLENILDTDIPINTDILKKTLD